jgi:hypothetical protein
MTEYNRLVLISNTCDISGMKNLPRRLSFKSFLLILTVVFLFTADSRAEDFKPVSCVNPRNPKETPSTDINGMAFIDEKDGITNFLAVVQVRKIDKVAILSVEAGKPTCTLLSWKGSPPDVPSGLEALTSIPGTYKDKGTVTQEFLALNQDGQIYHFMYDSSCKCVSTLGQFGVPSLPKGIDYEALALQKVGTELVIAWAERGRNHDPEAKLFWSRFVIDSVKKTYGFLGVELAKKASNTTKFDSTTINVPYPVDDQIRDISDLKIDTAGTVFIISTSDTEEAVKLEDRKKAFSSAFYSAGVFSIAAGKVEFKKPNVYTPMRKFDGQKVEALELVPGRYGGVAFATDNEEGCATFLFSQEGKQAKVTLKCI